MYFLSNDYGDLTEKRGGCFVFCLVYFPEYARPSLQAKVNDQDDHDNHFNYTKTRGVIGQWMEERC